MLLMRLGAESDEQVFDFAQAACQSYPLPRDSGWAVGWARRIRCHFKHEYVFQLVSESINWAHSLDYKCLYYTTGGRNPNAMRIRIADRKIEFITSLKNLRGSITKLVRGQGPMTRGATRLLAWRAPATPLNVSLVPTFLLAPSIGSPT
jgi:hypothetical protein